MLDVTNSSQMRIRIPALMSGVLTYFSLEQLRGRWTILCSIPSLDLIDAIFLNHQHDTFAQFGASFVALCRQDRLLHDYKIEQLIPLHVPILTDPLGRRRRAYNRSGPQGLRCQTSLLDPHLKLRLQIFHDLNARGIDALFELLSVIQQRENAVPRQGKLETIPALGRF